MKSDMLRILCREIREIMPWHGMDVGVSLQHFRDTIVSQTAKVLMMRGGTRPINAINGPDDANMDPRMELVMGIKWGGCGEEVVHNLVDDLVRALQGHKFAQRGGAVAAAAEEAPDAQASSVGCDVCQLRRHACQTQIPRSRSREGEEEMLDVPRRRAFFARLPLRAVSHSSDALLE